MTLTELFEPEVRGSLFSTDVISDSKRLAEIRDLWDAFVETHTDNPFMLSGFLDCFMNQARSIGWTPLLLVTRYCNAVVGVAPMMMRRKLGIRYARPLSIFHSIAASEVHTKAVVSNMVGLLFGRLGCQFATLVLPAGSPCTRILELECREKGIHFSQTEGMGQSILHIDRTWHELAKSRGKKLLQDIRRTECNLDHAGRWRVFCLRQNDRAHEVVERIMCVERMSWKQSHRGRRGQQVDQMLMTLWAGLQRPSPAGLNLRWSVWFLEVNDRTVAYLLVVEYKGVAFAIKTSYDQQYAWLGPGIYLMNAAIHRLFKERHVYKIDFISDAKWLTTWTSLCLNRIRFTMTSGRGLPRIVVFLFCRVAFRRKISNVICYSREWIEQASNAIPFSDLLLLLSS